MSIASQQRVIEEHQATIRDLRAQLATCRAVRDQALSVYADLVALCDETVVGGQSVVPVTVLRQIKPKGHGLK